MRIVMTGSPGTGKSSIARALSSALGLELIDIAEIARESGLVGKSHEVDVGSLSKALSFLKKRKSFLAEGHLACEMKLPADSVIVLRCRPDILRKRLQRRGYGKTKVGENVLSEALDYCTQRVLQVYGKRPLELETGGRSASWCAKAISSAVRNKKKTLDKIDYSDYLMRIAVEK